MTEEIIDDLKQFITGTVSQQLASQTIEIDKKFGVLDQGLNAKIDALDKKLSGKIDDLATSVVDAMDNSSEAVDKKLQDHETRIIRLEHKPA